MNILLIDCDSLLWQSCYCKKEEDPEGQGYIRQLEDATLKFESMFFNIFSSLEENDEISISHYKAFVQGTNNFRKIVNPSYKERRILQPTPPLFSELKQYVTFQYNPFISNGVETDDTIAATWHNLKATDFNGDRNIIIASVDKDYKQLGGSYFFDTYYTRMKLDYISEEQGHYHLFLQMLMGDKADDVVGVKGIGAKKAEAILKNVLPEHYMSAAYRQYVKAYGRKSREHWVRNIMMLKLVREGIEVPSIDQIDKY